MMCRTPVLDDYYMGIVAIVTCAQQLMFFIIAAYFKFDKVISAFHEISPDHHVRTCKPAWKTGHRFARICDSRIMKNRRKCVYPSLSSLYVHSTTISFLLDLLKCVVGTVQVRAGGEKHIVG
jgi:hypothetical protein